MWLCFGISLFLVLTTDFTVAKPGSRIVLRDGGYEGLVISIANDVPPNNCEGILDNLEVSCFLLCENVLLSVNM